MGNICHSCLISIGLLNLQLPKERIVYVNHQAIKRDEVCDEFPYSGNEVKSSRYTLINFIPKNLFEQLQRVANFYFLCIAIIQLFIDSPVSPIISILPLVFVLTVTAVKQGYEDFLRHLADREENLRKYKLLKDGVCVEILSQNIHVGDIIYIENNQAFPCDLLILSSSDSEGNCSVTTASLDGETNLKVFSSPEQTRAYSVSTMIDRKLRGFVECEQPQDDLYKFNGTLHFKDEDRNVIKIPLNSNNLLLRGAILRNTDFVWGCAVYTGSDTKLSLNSKGKATKFSQVERRLNRFLFSFIVVLFSLATFGCAMKYVAVQYFETAKPQNTWYLPQENITVWRVIQDFFGYLVLFNYLIPISLYVSIEMQKFFGSLFFGYDLEMFHVEYGTGQELPAKANTSDLNEELGQVEYLFSDKTGTLTENRMEFKECGIDGVKYSVMGNQLYIAALNEEDVARPVENWSEALENFFQVLALCHTVRVDAGTSSGATKSTLANGANRQAQAIMLDYQASSPDEKAFVEIAARFNCVFTGVVDNCQVINVKDTIRRYRILQVLEFDSTRKCMSVILEPLQSSTNHCAPILMLTKGAETSMLPRCVVGDRDKVMSQVNDYAAEGLRTLVIAQRHLSREEYEKIALQLNEATTTLTNRELKMAEAYDAIEQGLTLLGCTGIEDKLQDGVKDTIESLRLAGIQVWVLTGDKEETAFNISNSAGHFSSDMVPLRITRLNSLEACARRLADHQEFLRFKNERNTSVALIIDGQSLNFVLDPSLATKFLDLCIQSKAVLCCRCTPLQKSMVVAMVKKGIRPEPVTAAVGDGANDVSMILEAHVGLGIYGKEGRQAVRASDYALARFRFLKRALLYHGHFYYHRIALLVQYFFYKNVVFILAELYFSFFSSFSFVSVYDAFYLMLYNLTLSSLPILIFGVFEQYVPRECLMDEPALYSTIRRNQHLSWSQFLSWNVIGFYHSLVCYFAAHLVFEVNDVVNAGGSSFSLLGLGMIVVESVVITVNLKLLMESYFWNFAVLFGQVMTWVGYLTFMLLYSGLFLPAFYSVDMYWVWYKIHACPVVWLILIFSICLTLLPDLVLKALRDQRCGALFQTKKEPEDAFNVNSAWLRNVAAQGGVYASDASFVRFRHAERSSHSNLGYATDGEVDIHLGQNAFPNNPMEPITNNSAIVYSSLKDNKIIYQLGHENGAFVSDSIAT